MRVYPRFPGVPIHPNVHIPTLGAQEASKLPDFLPLELLQLFYFWTPFIPNQLSIKIPDASSLEAGKTSRTL